MSLMLSAAQPPFRTLLTIFSRRNGNACIKIADDLREQTKTISRLGIAVIIPKPESINKDPNFQLVMLDTVVHKSE